MMKLRERCYASALVFIVLAVSGIAVYADGLMGRDYDTQPYFHLWVGGGSLPLCDNTIQPTCEGFDSSNSLAGNLFTFSHPVIPSWGGQVTSWSYVNKATPDKHGTISGSFVIHVHLAWCAENPNNEACSQYGPIDGDIYVDFNANAQFVPKLGDEPNHYNFEGPFRITGGSGFYTGIIGSGTIGGTFHDHSWQDCTACQPWWDFVMIGKASFPPGHA
jgi:hypothetical protein